MLVPIKSLYPFLGLTLSPDKVWSINKLFGLFSILFTSAFVLNLQEKVEAHREALASAAASAAEGKSDPFI